MHRYVWQFHNGEILPKHHIHHKDGNKSNNSIENLELLSSSAHSLLHSKESEWIGSEKNLSQLAVASEKAKLWHRSEQGRLWHREHAKKYGLGEKKHEINCIVCGAIKKTQNKNKAMFCSSKCKQRYYYRKSKKTISSL
jgi:hypothetical protein